MLNRIAAKFRRWRQDPARLLRRDLDDLHGLTVVQIGANDGVTGDPIRNLLLEHPDWTGVFVEPVPFLFEKLKRNYGEDPRFRFENAAIADESGLMDFYYLPEEARQSMPELPVYYDQLGSFNKSHIAAHFPGIAESMIVSTRVPAMTFSELLQAHRIQSVDLLVLDTEGQDWAILKQVNLEQVRPRKILMEHLHLRFEERIDAMTALSRFYAVEALDGNWLCHRTDTAE